MAHWCEKYIGRPYVLGESDCAALYAEVSRDVFGANPPTAADVERAKSALGRSVQITDGVEQLGRKVEQPQEGDAVLMVCRGRPSHIGVFCVVNGENSVLHAMRNAGAAVLHRIRDLSRVSLSVEGYYTWK